MVTGLLVYTAPKQYVSETRLATGYTVSNKYSFNDEGLNPYKADMKFNNLIVIIESPILINVLSYKLLLHDLTTENPFSDFDMTGKTWEEEFGISQDSVEMILEKKISNFDILSSYDDVEKKIIEVIWKFGYRPTRLRELITIKRVNYTDYISIRCTTEDPFLSAYIVNTLTEEFLRYNNTLRYTRSNESVAFLDTLSRQKKRILDEKADELRRYKSQKRFLNFKLESESKIAQIKEAEAQREETLSNIRRLNLSIASIDSRVTDQQQDDIQTLRNTLTRLNERRRSGSADYQVLSDSIALIRNRLDAVVASSATDSNQELLDQRYELNVDLKVEEEKLKSIEERLSTLRRQASSFASSEATIAAMEREVDMASNEYLEVQEKLNDARNANANSKDNITVVVYGQPAIQPLSSGVLLKAGFSFGGAFLICVLIIVFSDFVDSRIKTVSRFEHMVGQKPLGTLYLEEPSKDNLLNKVERKLQKIQNKLIPSMMKDPVSLNFTQAMRKLRFQITSQEGRVLLFSSLKQGEGKSFVMFELAKSLGLVGKQVLIIDTNFRNNEFFAREIEKKHKRVLLKQSSKSKGVTLVGQNGTATVFEKQMITISENDNVHIIPNLAPDGSPSEILAGKDFSKMLNDFLEEGYDYIFFEAAAINDFSDAYELSVYADKVIMIFDATLPFDAQDRINLKTVGDFNGKLLGTILNNATSNV
ncbi:MAG: hypothetical protein Tsb0034_13250 [Ekhidna sp.]